jgi:erythromycin esterase
MHDHVTRPSRRDVLRYLSGGAAALAGASLAGGLPGAHATPGTPPTDAVARWIGRHARPLRTLDPAARLDDLWPLVPRLAASTVVGLGAPYGASEPFLLRHRTARLLVEHLGFRAIAVEEDWTKGLQLDHHVRTGQGDPRELLADASLPWQSDEMMALLTWMRAYNVRHPHDPVRFVGVDVVAVQTLAYDAVIAHVDAVAPHLVEELRTHYDELRPRLPIRQHIGWYRGQTDKQPFIDHARAARALVAGLPGDGHELAEQHARVIVAFHEYHASDLVAVRDTAMAEGVDFWSGHVRQRTVLLASNVHTAVADPLTITWGDMPPAVQTSAGGHLRNRLGRRYASVGYTFHHGEINAGFPLVRCPVPAPAPDFLEATLGADDRGAYVLPLGVPRPRAVRDWLDSSLRTRAIGPFYDPARDPEFAMSSARAGNWFDLVVHTQTTAPTHV